MRPPRPEPARQTLRRRLLLSLLLPLAALLLLGMPFDYRLAVSPAEEAYDYALTESAFELAARVVVRNGALIVDLPHDIESLMRADRTDQEFLAVYDPHGRLLAGDADLTPDLALPDSGLLISDTVLRGFKIRKATYKKSTSLGDVTVMFAETIRKRDRARSRILATMVLPNVLLVLATLVLVYFGVRRGLAPLNRLGQEIANRPAHDTSPIPKRDTPGEAEPLINAMNVLISELRAAAAAQQVFLANAAHQLKTPLSGLQTQLELAAQELPEEYSSRVVRLRDATKRLGHLTHQLLALARSGSEANIGNEHRKIDLAELLRASASSWFDAALAKDIDLGFEPEPAVVEGSEWLLRELLANLINNAIQYTQRGGTVTARSGIGGDGRPFMEVEDNGPGIPQGAHARIFDRFYRLADGSPTGTGLGLAIVKEVADRHDATISLRSSSPDGGTCIRVSFMPTSE
ncbi:MAG TPA: sensor histidine kinase [Noviherbaspirillum sp.]|nr:sensor histidine kinase [Noviherbaspirillum sp.]